MKNVPFFPVTMNIAKAFFRRGKFCQLSSSAMFMYCYLRRLRSLLREQVSSRYARKNVAIRRDNTLTLRNLFWRERGEKWEREEKLNNICTFYISKSYCIISVTTIKITIRIFLDSEF